MGFAQSPVSGDTPQRPRIASPGIISAKSRLVLRTKGFDPFAEILRASPESHRFLAKVPAPTPPGHAAACSGRGCSWSNGLVLALRAIRPQLLVHSDAIGTERK